MGSLSSSVFAKASWLCLLLVFTLTSGCDNRSVEDILTFENVGDPDLFEDDVSQPSEKKNADIVLRTAEENLVNSFQAALALHYHLPFAQYLDSNAMADVVPVEATYETLCSVSGTIALTTDIAPGDAIKEQDALRVDYLDCDEGDYQYTGSISYRYEAIEGLNDKYTQIDTEHCVARLAKQEDIPITDVVYVSADAIALEPFGEDVRILHQDKSPDQPGRYITKDATVVTQNKPFIVVKQPNDVNTDIPTSFEGGDVVYTMESVEKKEWNCQAYSRELKANITNLVALNDGLRYEMDGNVSVYQVSENLEDVQTELRDSSFTLQINEEQAERIFKFSNYTSSIVRSTAHDGYQISLNGNAQSSIYQARNDNGASSGGTVVELESVEDLQGVWSSPHPYQGLFHVRGRGVERVIAGIVFEDLFINVDYDGVEEIRNISIPDETFQTTWTNLLDRNYLFADIESDE